MVKKVFISINKRELGIALYQILDLDTNILGFKTAKITSLKAEDSSKKNLIKKLIESFKKEKIRYATIRVNLKDLHTINILENQGFRIIDGYLFLLKSLGREKQKYNLGVNIREAKLDDIKKLQDDIAHTFIYSRFFSDPLIKKDSAIMMHKIWIENCIKGKASEKVYAAIVNGEAVGFIAVEMDGKEGHINLIGVSPKYRGKQISQILTLYVIHNWFARKGAKLIRIETQLTNIPATKAYESLGFRLSDSAITLRWSEKR